MKNSPSNAPGYWNITSNS